MLRRVRCGVLWAIPAYLVGAFGGGFLVSLLSSNTHDRSIEAAMTGAFVLGPLAGLIGFVVGAVRAAPHAPPQR
jgi:ABC-type phosphate transport system permease subunit